MNNHDVMTAVLLKESIRTYIIRWNVTRLCNYNCSFCIQGNKKAHAEYAKGESAELRWRISLGIRNIIEKINSENFTAIRLFLIGGEVTILPELPELIANIINTPFQGEIAVHITTNLSADQDYYDHLLAVFKKQDYAGKRSLHIGASFYKDYTTIQTICGKLEYIRNHSQIDRTRRRDKFLNLLRKKKVIQKEHFCTASIGIPLISDEDFYEFLNTKKKLEKTCISCNPIIIRDYPTHFTEEIRQKIAAFDDNKQNLVVELTSGEYRRFINIQAMGVALDDVPYFNPKEYYCDAGWTAITVSNKGIIYRCPNTVNKEPIGDAAKGEFSPLCQLQECSSNRCVCSYYHIITKDQSFCSQVVDFNHLNDIIEHYKNEFAK